MQSEKTLAPKSTKRLREVISIKASEAKSASHHLRRRISWTDVILDYALKLFGVGGKRFIFGN